MDLEEKFDQPSFNPKFQWLNPPKVWRIDPSHQVLVIEPESQTDFWQKTHYGFAVDNGHVLAVPVQGDLNLSTRISFRPLHEYDQAGLILWNDPTCWIKASVEHALEGPPQIGTVVTSHGYSDWSMQDFLAPVISFELLLARTGSDVTVFFRLDARADWKMMRMARWDPVKGSTIYAGIYACSPKNKGFAAEFSLIRLS